MTPARVLVALVTLALAGTAAPANASEEPAHVRRHATPAIPPVSAPDVAREQDPTWARLLPDRTSQVVRTVRTDRWCERRWCTVTQLWQRETTGDWVKAHAFRSTIGPNGFGKRREGDHRSPSGVYRIRVTFSTGDHAPGEMPWKRRLPTSNVTSRHGRLYNTWIEEPGRTDGDRASMHWGFIVNYNRPRLEPGVGPKPVVGKGSGIFYHTSLNRHTRWGPTDGCTQLGIRKEMRYVLQWLDPAARPRVVQAR